MQLMMPAETARDTIAALGQAGQLQFKDLCEDKSPLQRTFANQVLLHSSVIIATCTRRDQEVMVETRKPLQPQLLNAQVCILEEQSATPAVDLISLHPTYFVSAASHETQVQDLAPFRSNEQMQKQRARRGNALSHTGKVNLDPSQPGRPHHFLISSAASTTLLIKRQVKRTDELSRKMRFFTDQVEKSGVITGARTGVTENLKLDELEVSPSRF